MDEQQGIKRLGSLQRRWKAEGFAWCLLLALTVSVLPATAFHVVLGWTWGIGGLFFLVCCAVALRIFPYWRISLTDITRYLDRQLPELEESCGLLLRPVDELGPLEQLQAARTEARLRPLRMPRPFRKKWRFAGGSFLGAVILGGCIVFVAGPGGRERRSIRPAVVMKCGPEAVTAVPGVKDVKIYITPPAYTGRGMRHQTIFPLRVEEGALLSWEIETSGAVDTVLFLFNDTTRSLLRPANTGRTLWRMSLSAVHPGFYQVRVGSQLSELYTLEVIKDEPPKIIIRSPKAYTFLDYGESTRVPLLVKLQDDYGISDAAVMATVSSGKGEAVKFKEQELRWDKPFTGGQSVYDLSKTLDLSALGLKPGDELYFYCRAKDNHGQEARTDMYIITLADTAQLMSLEGMTVATDVKPEFFRSERQIIIETEQLLREKDTLTATAFNNKSNDLGIDQKLLRLRYGKFLGEEAEEGGPENIADKPGAFGDAAAILDAYTDKHDNAEDATYFEPAIKAQLKATLSEMWNAELRLRTYKPREALPYAYKALRLLKDLQQQSRAYVAKTGVRVTPLNPAKRLTGELTAIRASVQRAGRETGLTEEEVLRIVLGILEADPRMGGKGSRVLLGQAEERLGKEATSRPVEFLAGYQAMRRVVAREAEVTAADVLSAEQAIRKLLPAAQAVPVPGGAAADAGLSQIYFSHLNKP